MKMLIADDDPIHLRILQGMLERADYEVVTAADGLEAWQILEANDSPMLAILDWMMPGLDGPAICQRLRQRQTHTPTYVILLTANADKDSVVAGLAAGANDYICKPYSAEELRARVQVGRTLIELQATVARRMREFEDYVDDAPLGILVVERNGEIRFGNNAAHDIFGYPRGELERQSVEMLVPDSLRQRHVQLRNEFMRQPQGRSTLNRTIMGQRHDSSQVPLAIGLSPIPRESPDRIVCSIMDLSALRSAEQQLQQFFDLSPDLFAIAHTNGFLLRVNPLLKNLLGYSEAELLSRPFYEFIHPEDVPLAGNRVEQLASGQAVADFRCRMLDRAGNEHWVEWSSGPASPDGTFHTVGRNITERLKMEGEIKYRIAREEAILDKTPAVVCIKDLHGRYEYVNPRHVELFSKDPVTALGKTARDFFTEAEAIRIERDERQVVETGQTVAAQQVIARDDGEHTFLAVTFPLLDAHGKVSATASIRTEITEQIRTQERKRELQLAQAFQHYLYPKNAQSIAGVDIAAATQPATALCGDYFDYFQLGPLRLMVGIGDVSGHGVGPALQMTRVSCMTRILGQSMRSLPAIMRHLNHDLCESLPDNTFVSMFLAEIDLAHRHFSYVGAGHESILVSADGTVRTLESTHVSLGVVPDVTFSEPVSCDLQPGDVLLFFTDGLSEAISTERVFFGKQRVADIVRGHRGESSQQIIEALLREVRAFAGNHLLKDDITLVAVKIPR
ncbi:MAG: SpoIIE family protein phosphatase [Pirellulales bacterium]